MAKITNLPVSSLLSFASKMFERSTVQVVCEQEVQTFFSYFGKSEFSLKILEEEMLFWEIVIGLVY